MTLPRTDLESLICSVWRDIFGTAPASIYEDFFAAGLSSIQAAVLAASLSSTLAAKVPLDFVFDSPTVAALALRLGEDPHHRNLSCFRLQAGERVPLLLTPTAGGSVATLHAFADPSFGRNVFGLSSKGLHGEADPACSVADIAEHLLSSARQAGVSGPIHLLGSCIGGLACVEMANRAPEFGMIPMSVTLINTAFSTEAMLFEEIIAERLNNIRSSVGLSRRTRLPLLDEIDLQIEELFKVAANADFVAENTLRDFSSRIRVFANNCMAAQSYVPTAIRAPLTIIFDKNESGPDGVCVDKWEKVRAPAFRAMEFEDIPSNMTLRPDIVAAVAELLLQLESSSAIA